MTFNHLTYNQKFLANPGYNDSQAYGVTVSLAHPQLNQPYWRCIGIHHLTGSENAGNHHVYLDVLDEAGKRLNGSRLMVVNSGKAPFIVFIDKPPNEAGANVPMYWNDTLDIYIGGDLPSDKAQGFHIRHEDEEGGTTRGHHSFYAVWQRQPGTTVPEPPIPPVDDWREGLTPLQLQIVNNPQAISDLIVKMRDTLDNL